MNSVLLDELGQPETKIGDGKDVTLSVSGGAPYAAWVKDSLLVLWHSGKLDVIAQQTAFPNLSALPGGGVPLAWETSHGISIGHIR